MFVQKITQVRPSVDVEFAPAEFLDISEQFFKQRAEHASFRGAYYDLSEDRLTYTRYTLFDDEAGYWSWFYDCSATRLFYDFSHAHQAVQEANNITLKIEQLADFPEADLQSLTKIDVTQPYSEILKSVN